MIIHLNNYSSKGAPSFRQGQSARSFTPWLRLEANKDYTGAQEQHERTENATLVALQESEPQALNARGRQPGENHHPRDGREGEHRAEHDESNPAIADAG